MSCSEQDKVDKYKTILQGDWSDLDSLPPDTGGEHCAVLGKEYPGANNGFYIYLPQGYEQSPVKYPAIIFLHGQGESGNSMHNPEVLSSLLGTGIPKMINKGLWNPPVPFFVISPQTESTKYWDGFGEILDSLIQKYPIDISRIYATGLSMGGFGVWGYMAGYGDSLYIAAGVPICGTVFEYEKNPDLYSGNLAGFPIWAFHGENDLTVPAEPDRAVVEAVNKLNPIFRVKYTQFPELGHNVWNVVYESHLDTKTDPDYDPFDMDIYTWMLQYRRIKK